MMSARAISGLLAVTCVAAALFGSFGRAHGSSQLPGGLAPLPGNAPVPLHDRPPGATRDDGGPSPVIFPPQQITIRMNHRLHIKELGLTCLSCHTKAKTSRKSSDSLLPEPTVCDACHGTDHRDLHAVKDDWGKPISQCSFCHTEYDEKTGRVARTIIPTPNLHFDHAVHVRRNISCQQCHGAVQNIELATRDQLPRMRGCLRCHQMPEPARGDAKGECQTCHVTERGMLMKTQFASGTLVPPRWLHNMSHGPDWLARHKQVAGADSTLCASCHSERECVDCHDGRVRPRQVHPNDWISMHPIAARQNSPDCTSCHREQSFCLGCHQRAGVTLSGPLGNVASRGRFHPPKAQWTDPPRGPGHHGWEAQRNIGACVSCHVERDCAMCHATAGRGGRGAGPGGGLGQGVNPHPAGFRARCGGALRKNARPCLVCHEPSDPLLRECR
jgi:hypothetical protein